MFSIKKNKFYRRYRSDVSGLLVLKRKNNKIIRTMIRYADQDFRSRINGYPRTLKRKILREMSVKGHRPEYVNALSVRGHASEKRKKRLSHKGVMLSMRKKLLYFYGFFRRRSSLRKLAKKHSVLPRTTRDHTIIYQNQYFRYSDKDSSFGSFLEARLDVLAFRSLFAFSILKAKFLIRRGFISMAIPRSKFTSFSLFCFKTQTKLISAPLFTPIKLLNPASHRKLLLSRITHIFYPPSYLYVDFRLMLSMRILESADNLVKYYFPDRKSVV